MTEDRHGEKVERMHCGLVDGIMRPKADGAYVYYADYAKLEEELNIWRDRADRVIKERDRIGRDLAEEKLVNAQYHLDRVEMEAAQSAPEKLQPSPTWDEVDAIRKGKSDIDLAERIWRLEQELRILKRAHGDALKEWAYAEGLLKELRSATAPLDELDRRLSERANRYMGTVEDYYLHGLWMAREEIKSLRAADKTASDKGQG